MDDSYDIADFITDRTRRTLGRRIYNPRFQALLDAGMSLLKSRVGAGVENPFSFPSTDAVCIEASRLPPFAEVTVPAASEGLQPIPDRKRLNSAQNAFKKSWTRTEHYRADLAMYTLTMPAWFAGDEIAHTALQQMIASPETVDVVLERIACQDLHLFENSLFRVQLVMQAMSPTGDVIIGQALDRMYKNIDRTWTTVYQGMLDHYKLQLRPDVTVADITSMLTATAEGTGLRRLVQFSNESIYNAIRQRSILGKAALCFFSASIAPDGDTRTLAAHFRTALTSAVS
ncbi:hypothetical protein [Actinoplanes sp. NPDC023714]|uniref:hypothetical protein n=1 Tax=Actinoplanes sp. NPDC023714 TaxID=3154322 RepID=UPI0033F8D0DE